MGGMVMKAKDFFGKWISYTHKVQKIHPEAGRYLIKTRQLRVHAPGRGLCIGYRTLPETDTSFEYYEDRFELSGDGGKQVDKIKRVGSVQVLIIVPGARYNPLKVSLIGAKLLEKEIGNT